MRLRLALLVGIALPGAARAATPEVGPALMPSLLQTTLGLALVLALIWGAAWAIRRVAPGAARPNALLRTVATLAVGQRERVVVVEVADQWLVLGVSAGGINALSTLPKGSAPPQPATPPFARLLARATGRGDAP
jgi:flagellar protein FliO/FliZ